MRFLKSKAFKVLDSAPEQMASNLVAFCESRGEKVTHGALATYLGGFLGFAEAQAVAFGDLRDREFVELEAKYAVVATMFGVRALADGPLVKADKFQEIVSDMRGYTYGFGFNMHSALGTLLERQKRTYKISRETIGGVMIHSIREGKTLWPGGPSFERPSD